jgi:hypothetical protein
MEDWRQMKKSQFIQGIGHACFTFPISSNIYFHLKAQTLAYMLFS